MKDDKMSMLGQFIEVEKDIFVDKLGIKYSLEDIKNNIKIGDN